MKLKKLLLMALIFVVSCSETPIQKLKSFDKEFKNRAVKIKQFAKRENSGTLRTRDITVVEKLIDEAKGFVEYVEKNAQEYQGNINILSEKDKQYKGIKFFNFQAYSYQYCKRHLSDVLERMKKRIKFDKNYKVTLRLPLAVIFKKRPKGLKPGGSKKYESIRKKFN